MPNAVPASPAAQEQPRDPLTVFDGLFASTDNWSGVLPASSVSRINAQLAGSVDPKTDRMRMANQAWLAHSFKKPAGEVADGYEGYKQAWAKQVLGTDKPMDDATFYASTGQWMQKRKAERVMLNDMAAGMFDGLRKGKTFDQSFEDQRRANWLSNKGWEAKNQDRYRELLRSTWNNIGETRSRLEPLIDELAGFYRYARAGTKPGEGDAFVAHRDALVKKLGGLNANDREMAMDFASGMASTDATPEKGFLEKLGGRLARGSDTLGFEAIQGFHQLTAPMGVSFDVLNGDVERSMMARVTGEVDPLKANGWIANGLLDASESFPRMAISLTPPGIAVNVMAYKSELRADFLARGVSPMEAQGLSAVAALPYAALDYVSAKMVFGGTVPGLDRVLAPIKSAAGLTFSAGAKRAAVIFGVELGEQYLQEAAQDLTAPTVQAMAGLLNDKIPAVDWRKEFARVGAASPQTLAALLPLVLIGTTTATFKERGYGKKYVQQVAHLEALGFTPDAIQGITAAKTPDEANAVMAREWNRRKTDTPVQQAAVEKLNQDMATAADEVGMPAAEPPSVTLKPLPAGATVEFQGAKHAMFEGVGPKVDHWLVKLPGETRGEVLTAEALANRGFVPPSRVPDFIKSIGQAQTIADMDALGKTNDAGLSGLAHEIGLGVTTPAEVRALETAAKEFADEARAVMNGPGSIESKFDLGQMLSTKAQLFREAHEAATGEGSAGLHLRTQNENFRPPITRNADGTLSVTTEDGTAHVASTPEEAASILRGVKPGAAPVDLSTPGASLDARAAATNTIATGAQETDMPADAEFTRYGSQPNRARLALTAQNKGGVSAPQVMAAFGDIVKAFGGRGSLMIRIGRMGRKAKTALGFYRLRERIIRIGSANNLETAAHEVAHALDDAVFGIGHGWGTKVVPADAHAELMQLGRDLYGSRNPVGGYASEGWAEFVRLWLLDPEQAQTKAPQLWAHMGTLWGKMDPAVQLAAERAQKLGTTFYRQGAMERARQSIAQQPSRFAVVAERAKTALETVRRKWIESAQPIKDFVDAAVESGGPIPDAVNPFFTLTARRLTADSIVDYMARTAMIDHAGNVTGKPLQDAFAIVKDKRDDFVIYLWAKRALALWDTNRNPGLAKADAEQLVAELETPAFELAAQQVYDWNNAVLDYAAQAVPDFREVVKKIRAVDPGFYIPLFREFTALDDRYGGGGVAGGKNLVKRLKGSGRRIKDPVESMIAQAKAIVLKTQQKIVLDQILKLAQRTEGMGAWVSEVPQNQVPERVAGWQVAKQVKKFLESQANTPEAKALAQQIGDTLKDELDGAALTFFIPAHQPKQNEAPILPVMKGGEVKWYEMDPELYKALSGMDLAKLPAALDLFLGLPARMVRLGTTGLRAAFSLVTNPLRDFRTLQMNSTASSNSGQLFGLWLSSMREMAVEAMTFGKIRSQWADVADRLGIEMAQSLGQDTRPLQRAARRVKRGGAWAPLDMADNFDLLRELLQFPETAARLAEIRAVAKDLGWDPSQRLTPAIAAKLIVAGKQVTTDFTAAGEWARLYNQAVPFFNAGIQGPRAHVRAFQRDPHKFVLRGLMGTALALALWWRNKDEPWWQEMSSKEKYLFSYIPAGDELIRLPRSFEVDGLFMASTEAMLDAWYQNDPAAVKDWFGNFASNITQIDSAGGVPVPPVPVLTKLAAEQLANRDFFFNRPIVPRGELENVRPEEQYNEFTTAAAIAAGGILKISPRRIDHTIRNLFGPVGIDLVGLFGHGDGSATTTRELEAADTPVLGVLFQRGGQVARNPKSVEALYDRYEDALKIQRSKREQETDEQKQVRLMLQDAVRAQTALAMIQKHTAGREERRQLALTRIAVARSAVKMADSGEVDRAQNLEILGEARQSLMDEMQDSEPPAP